MSEENGTTKNILSPANFYKLCRALQKMKGRIKDEVLTREKVAEHLSALLGFLVTPANLKTAGHAVGITWAIGGNRSLRLSGQAVVNRGAAERIRRLEDRLDRAERRLAAIMPMIVELGISDPCPDPTSRDSSNVLPMREE